jgi:coenzyme F420 hydrogenase subunit beta
MVDSPPGYLRPLQEMSVTAKEEERIAAACPGLGQCIRADGRTDDVLWGPYLHMYRAWATDPQFRHAGSSGGALSAILLHLLEKGIVDAAVANGPDPHYPARNRTVVVRDRAAVLAAAGSRYAPSSPLSSLNDMLEVHRQTGRRLAFVGKPCDVAALRALTVKDPEIASAFPVLVSFFCAGVPSYAGGEALLTSLDAKTAIAFRYRGNGWPGRATATLPDGSERSMSYQESWGKILSKHVQHRCKICADGTGTAADIVCADAWVSDEKGYPRFEETPGISLIVTRTELGSRLVASAVESGALQTAPFDPAELTAIQPGQRERRRALLARLLALRVALHPVPRYEGLRLIDAALQNSIFKNTKNFLGMLRRIYFP